MRMGRRSNSEDARERSSETAVGGSERPARRIGSGGPGSDDGEVLMDRASRGWGDNEGGEAVVMPSGRPSTAFPFPLSTFGPSFSSLKRSCVVPSLGVSSAK